MPNIYYAFCSVALSSLVPSGAEAADPPSFALPALTESLPAPSGEVVGKYAAVDAPTSRSIPTCASCAGYFGISDATFSAAPAGAAKTNAAKDNPGVIAQDQQDQDGSNSVIAPIAVSGACPKGHAYPDGCLNAPRRRPESPELLSGYVRRPPWNVAGVDYGVGVPTGISLKDPALISMAGVSVNKRSRTVTISGNNITLRGYDFSLHGGYQLVVTGNNNTIANCNFALGTNTGYYLIDGLGSVLRIVYCTMDASTWASGGKQTSLIAYSGSGKLSLEYNWLKNFPQHVLELTQPNGVNFSVVYKYNLIWQGALEAGAHLNYLQFGGAQATSVDVEFNTSYQTPQASGGEGYQFYDNTAGGTISNVTLGYNTIIATRGKVGAAMSYLVHGNNDSILGATIDRNYVDISAAYGAFYPGTWSGWRFNNNFNMKNGRMFSNSPP